MQFNLQLQVFSVPYYHYKLNSWQWLLITHKTKKKIMVILCSSSCPTWISIFCSHTDDLNFDLLVLQKKIVLIKINVALRTPARATITFDQQLHYLIILSPIQSNSKLYPHCRKNARDFNAVLTFAVRGPWTLWSSSNPFYVSWTFFLFFCGREHLPATPLCPSVLIRKKHWNLSEFCVSVCRICRSLRLTSRSRNIVLNCSSAEIAI